MHQRIHAAAGRHARRHGKGHQRIGQGRRRADLFADDQKFGVARFVDQNHAVRDLAAGARGGRHGNHLDAGYGRYFVKACILPDVAAERPDYGQPFGHIQHAAAARSHNGIDFSQIHLVHDGIEQVYRGFAVHRVANGAVDACFPQ